MNTIKYFLAIIAIAVASFGYSQSTTKTIKFKVDGNCDMCKKRIENALDVKGIKYANWDVKTKQIEITYKTDKISEDQIHQLIANVGHDTEKVKATKENYNKLHGCCKYRENPE
ncbi:MAG: heavy-metal-associated domain-containing protein [Bacteroidia bacterium]